MLAWLNRFFLGRWFRGNWLGRRWFRRRWFGRSWFGRHWFGRRFRQIDRGYRVRVRAIAGAIGAATSVGGLRSGVVAAFLVLLALEPAAAAAARRARRLLPIWLLVTSSPFGRLRGAIWLFRGLPRGLCRLGIGCS